MTRSALQAGVKHLAAVEVDKRFIPILEVNVFMLYASLYLKGVELN